MKKEKTVFIDVSQNNISQLNKTLFKTIIDSFLIENKHIKLDRIIIGNDLYNTFIEILNNNKEHVKDPFLLYKLLERIYDYWRNIKRYVVSDLAVSTSVNENNFLNQFDLYNETFLNAYRSMCCNLLGEKFSVFRQLPAYSNAILLLDRTSSTPFRMLDDVKVVSRIAFKPPFVSYSASNKREGIFPIIKKNPLVGLDLKTEKWYMFPILVGTTKTFVYFSEQYMSLGVSLSNLFEHDSSFKTTKPDCIIVFGSNTANGIYYDEKTKTYIGSLVSSERIDYFGYLKKIILTVHNIKMIRENKWPIQGAGVSIVFKNGIVKNVVLIGDSGAGKSETLEALREISSDDIIDILTIYDDMGTFSKEPNGIYTFGTEIGAFVRTDDLANYYVYKVFDRAIFLNPNGKNARLVLPISNYQDVITKRKVDLVLYANNYQMKKNKNF